MKPKSLDTTLAKKSHIKLDDDLFPVFRQTVRTQDSATLRTWKRIIDAELYYRLEDLIKSGSTQHESTKN